MLLRYWVKLLVFSAVLSVLCRGHYWSRDKSVSVGWFSIPSLDSVPGVPAFPPPCLLTNTGVEYRGSKSITKTGHKCLNWNKVPNKIYPTKSNKILKEPQYNLLQQKNSSECRNPGGVLDTPSCFKKTSEGYAELESCGIKHCRSLWNQASSFLGEEFKGNLTEVKQEEHCQRPCHRRNRWNTFSCSTKEDQLIPCDVPLRGGVVTPQIVVNSAGRKVLVTPITQFLYRHNNALPNAYKIADYGEWLNISFAVRLADPRELTRYQLTLVLSEDIVQSASVSLAFDGSQLTALRQKFVARDNTPRVERSQTAQNFDPTSMSYQWLHFKLQIQQNAYKSKLKAYYEGARRPLLQLNSYKSDPWMTFKWLLVTQPPKARTSLLFILKSINQYHQNCLRGYIPYPHDKQEYRSVQYVMPVKNPWKIIKFYEQFNEDDIPYANGEELQKPKFLPSANQRFLKLSIYPPSAALYIYDFTFPEARGQKLYRTISGLFLGITSNSIHAFVCKRFIRININGMPECYEKLQSVSLDSKFDTNMPLQIEMDIDVTSQASFVYIKVGNSVHQNVRLNQSVYGRFWQLMPLKDPQHQKTPLLFQVLGEGCKPDEVYYNQSPECHNYTQPYKGSVFYTNSGKSCYRWSITDMKYHKRVSIPQHPRINFLQHGQKSHDDKTFSYTSLDDTTTCRNVNTDILTWRKMKANIPWCYVSLNGDVDYCDQMIATCQNSCSDTADSQQDIDKICKPISGETYIISSAGKLRRRQGEVHKFYFLPTDKLHSMGFSIRLAKKTVPCLQICVVLSSQQGKSVKFLLGQQYSGVMNVTDKKPENIISTPYLYGAQKYTQFKVIRKKDGWYIYKEEELEPILFFQNRHLLKYVQVEPCTQLNWKCPDNIIMVNFQKPVITERDKCTIFHPHCTQRIPEVKALLLLLIETKLDLYIQKIRREIPAKFTIIFVQNSQISATLELQNNTAYFHERSGFQNSETSLENKQNQDTQRMHLQLNKKPTGISITLDGQDLILPSFEAFYVAFTAHPKNTVVVSTCNDIPVDMLELQQDGSWSPWSAWYCNTTCGGGYGTRWRQCANPPPSMYGAPCKGPRVHKGHCNMHPCGAVSEDQRKSIQRSILNFNRSKELKAAENAKLTGKTHQYFQLKNIHGVKFYWLHDDMKFSEEGQRYSPPPVSFYSILQSQTNLINVEVHEDDLFIYSSAPHHQGLWLFFVSMPSGIDQILTIISVTVTAAGTTVKAIEGNVLYLQCGGKSLVLFQDYDLNMAWYHDGEIYLQLPNVDVNVEDKLTVKNVQKAHEGIWRCQLKYKNTNAVFITAWYRVQVDQNLHSNYVLQASKIFGIIQSQISQHPIVQFFVITVAVTAMVLSILRMIIIYEKIKEVNKGIKSLKERLPQSVLNTLQMRKEEEKKLKH